MLKATTNFAVRSKLCFEKDLFGLQTIEADNPQKLKNSKPRPNFSGSYQTVYFFCCLNYVSKKRRACSKCYYCYMVNPDLRVAIEVIGLQLQNLSKITDNKLCRHT